MFKRILFGFFLCVGAVGAMADAVNLQKTVGTRYGKLSADDENNLLFKGKIVQPNIAGNNGLYLEKIFQIGNQDIALIYDLGGNVCPASYYFLTLSSNGIQATSSFGTCAHAISFQKENNQNITVVIPGFIAMPENVSSRELKRISSLKNKYTYKAGAVYLNGKKLTEHEIYLDGKKAK